MGIPERQISAILEKAEETRCWAFAILTTFDRQVQEKRLNIVQAETTCEALRATARQFLGIAAAIEAKIAKAKESRQSG